MNMIAKFFETRSGLRACGWIAAFVMAIVPLTAQTPAVRIRTEINSSEMTQLKTTLQPQARTELEAGRVPSNEKLSGMSIVFSRSAAQQAALEKLIAAQQDPASPQYHQWLSPEQFAAKFGMAQADIDKVQTWLQQQGFAIDSVARSKNMIRFSGTAGQVELAFQTQMHYYKGNGQTHLAPSTVLSVPTAIASTVATVGNLSDFRPRPLHVRARRGFTSGISGGVFFGPGDIATTYDIKPLYTAGNDGTGQSIAIVGQSAIQAGDIEAFESAAGLTKKDPVMVLVPGSGTSTVYSGGDEGESDLDVEWAGGIAPGATINFVYVGNNSTMSAFDSLAYAIDEKIATIITSSYGACELAVQGSSTETMLESALQQASTQGQTVIAASGDQGSTACQGDTQNGLTSAEQLGLAVNYPASSQYVTAVGGTEISSADGIDPTTGNKGANYGTYWNSNGSNDVVSSAKTYIPEVAWNDDALAGSVTPQNGGGLSASGGGASALFTKPSWQTGVAGIPNDGHRDIPDVSLYSSPDLPGYLFCTSDTSDWATTATPPQAASCSSGFRDGASGGNYLTLAGGTSFAAPIFAGMMALINQKQQWTEGQGPANMTLYKLAADSSTYASAFHDVTSGNNYCTAGTTYGYCNSTGATEGFKAGTGYDQVTGLGSVDLTNLAGAWPANATPLLATTTAVSAASATPNVSTDDVITITVSNASGSGSPTGTVDLSIDGGGTANYNNSGSTTSVTLSSGTATYTANFATNGVHTIVARYAGDATHAASTGSVFVTVGGTSSGKGTFAVSFNPSTLTVKQGSSGTETVTVTPSGGYTGTVDLSYVTSNDTALANLCVFASTGLNSDGSIAVGSSAVQGQITVDTNASDCVGTTVGIVKGRGLRLIPHTKGLMSQNNVPRKSNPLPAGIALAGFMLAGFLGRSSRKLRNLACVIALASLGLMMSACGGTSGNTVSDPAKGSYMITFTGMDSANNALTSQSVFTLTIN
jgi:subtilase family serine protease